MSVVNHTRVAMTVSDTSLGFSNTGDSFNEWQRLHRSHNVDAGTNTDNSLGRFPQFKKAWRINIWTGIAPEFSNDRRYSKGTRCSVLTIHLGHTPRKILISPSV
jgi:hypothetical protein